jgi:threonine synthase
MMGLPIRRLVVATNENDVLDEFFRTGRYRPRGSHETLATSSPSMDISKASNFERFVFDLCQRDAHRVSALWAALQTSGEFQLAGQPEFARMAEFGFVSGAGNHAARLAAIRDVHNKYGRVIDPHTADGIAVCSAWREDGVPMICLETALAAKFDETTREALGISAPRPPRFAGIEESAQQFILLPPDAAQLKRIIAARAAPAH